MSETTTATKPPALKTVTTLSGLLVLGTEDIQLAAAHIRAELHVEKWGGSFPGKYVRRYSGTSGKGRWSVRSDLAPMPKDAVPGVLFTSPRYRARREPFDHITGDPWVRAWCTRGHSSEEPNTGLGRARLATWESRHQHVRGGA